MKKFFLALLLVLLVVSGPSAQISAADIAVLMASALQGNMVAQSNLSYLYNSGKGVAQDFNSAAFWYRKSAEQGHD